MKTTQNLFPWLFAFAVLLLVSCEKLEDVFPTNKLKGPKGHGQIVDSTGVIIDTTGTGPDTIIVRPDTLSFPIDSLFFPPDTLKNIDSLACLKNFQAVKDTVIWVVTDTIPDSSATLLIDVLKNDLFCRELPTQLQIVKQGNKGVVTVEGEEVKYVPSSQKKNDAFQYKLCVVINGQLQCSEASVLIKVR